MEPYGKLGAWSNHVDKANVITASGAADRLLALGAAQSDRIRVLRTEVSLDSPWDVLTDHVSLRTTSPVPMYYVWCFTAESAPNQCTEALLEASYTNVVWTEKLEGSGGVYSHWLYPTNAL